MWNRSVRFVGSRGLKARYENFRSSMLATSSVDVLKKKNVTRLWVIWEKRKDVETIFLHILLIILCPLRKLQRIDVSWFFVNLLQVFWRRWNSTDEKVSLISATWNRSIFDFVRLSSGLHLGGWKNSVTWFTLMCRWSNPQKRYYRLTKRIEIYSVKM